MPLYLHFRKDLKHLPPFVDEEGRARDAPVGAAGRGLFHPHPVLFDHLVVHIGQQGMRDAQLVLPLCVGLDGICAHPEDHRVELLVCRVIVTERGGLNRSAWGVITHVEPQHDLLTPVIS